MRIYLLSCEIPQNGGGVYSYELTENGKLKKLRYFPCDRSMYAVKCKNGLCVLLRQPFSDTEDSGYFFIDEELNDPSKLFSTKGKCACHLTAEDSVYIANYLSGNIVKDGEEIVQRQGNSVHPARQTAAHTHFVGVTPDDRLVVCDLGTDTLAFYDKNLRLLSEVQAPSGYGIRHLVFSADKRYIYAVNELGPSISVFAYKNGKAKLVNTFTIPCANPSASGAAIRISRDGMHLYVSVREENALYLYFVNGEILSFLRKRSCGGDSPRDFNLCGEYLVCCNEKSGNVTVYKTDFSFDKIDEIAMKGALCCVV